MDIRPGRHKALIRGDERRRGKEKSLQPPIVHTLGERPSETGRLGPPQIACHRRVPHRAARRDLMDAEPHLVSQPQNLPYLAHRQPLRWHLYLQSLAKGIDYHCLATQRPTFSDCRGDSAPRMHPCSHQGWPHSVGTGDRVPSESASAFRRNGCPRSVGITVRFASEYACQGYKCNYTHFILLIRVVIL